ncbi:MAG: HAMP domain-containing protein [Deltaproteobacteria bacterium]|nr:HAMP domain-containing protein [Deltaproteobacteria bacterium]
MALTLGASWFVFDRLVSRALTIALNEEVEDGLRWGLQARRDLFDGWKRTYRTAARGHARDHRLVAAVADGQAGEASLILEKLLEDEEDALRFTLEIDGLDDPIVVGHDDDEYPTREWRRFEVSMQVGASARLTETYVVPWSVFKEFDEAGRVLSTFQTFKRNRDDFRLGFVWFYLVTLGVVSLVVGGAVFLYSLKFGRRIGRLGDATQRVGRGDLEVRVVDPVGDELSDLAHAFNTMVREIREGRERIEYLQRVSAWQEFARRLAHEIKNPLTPIRLAIQEIKTKYTGDDPRFRAVLDESHEIIEEEVAVLRRLTSEFSSFARLPRVNPRPTDLGEFLSDVCPSLESFARSRNVALEYREPRSPLPVEIDSTMLRRVLDNLVHNAVEAIERGGGEKGRIHIEAGGPGSGSLVSIRITDNGPGIDVDDVEDIFAPYYTTRPDGTGLGLAIVKKVVLEHGGTLSVAKTGPGGTTFAIDLPLAAREPRS